MPEVFTLFPRLPLDLRILIWEHCIPSRVVELETRNDRNIPSNCHLLWSSLQNARPPIITRVCHESRSVALRSGYLISRNEPIGMGLMGTWFDARHDTVVWWWVLFHHRWQMLNTGAVMEYFLDHVYRTQTQQPLIMTDQIYPFDYFNGPPKPHMDHLGVWEVAQISQLKHNLVCLRMVSLHMTAERALKSNLFGLTGEQLVQVVDPSDKSQIRKFSNECHPKDQKAQRFFQLALDSEKLDVALKEWKRKIATHWVWSRWLNAYGNSFAEIPYPDDIWLGPRIDAQGQPLNMLHPFTFYTEPPMGREFRMSQYSPKMDHPWVKEILAEMPNFQPVFVFRLCVMRCYKIPRIEALEGVRGNLADVMAMANLSRANPQLEAQKEEKRKAARQEWDRSESDRQIMERR